MPKMEAAFKLLADSIKEHQQEPRNKTILAGLIKAFEISFEYVWKAFKQEANQAGYEAYNPRDAIKAAAEMGLIEDFELWKTFLNARNMSVHDYLGVADAELVSIARSFLKETKKLKLELK